MYDIEQYYNAKTVSEAVMLLKEHPDARIISGGSDVLIKIREGRMAGTSLVSIRDIEEIKGITGNENGDPIIQKYIPVLGEAVDQVGGPQIRNIGTIGGNICNGAVSADSVPTVFSYNSLLHIANEDGGRITPVREFYLGPGRVDLHPGEVLTHVVIPKKEYAGYHGHYIKYSMRNAMDIATLSCSVVSKVDTEKNILEDVRITFGVAAPVPYRCVETEEKLKGRILDESFYQELEESIRGEIHPRDSWRASRDFRLQIGGEIAKRALLRTVELARMDNGMGGEEA